MKCVVQFSVIVAALQCDAFINEKIDKLIQFLYQVHSHRKVLCIQWNEVYKGVLTGTVYLVEIIRQRQIAGFIVCKKLNPAVACDPEYRLKIIRSEAIQEKFHLRM